MQARAVGSPTRRERDRAAEPDALACGSYIKSLDEAVKSLRRNPAAALDALKSGKSEIGIFS